MTRRLAVGMIWLFSGLLAMQVTFAEEAPAPAAEPTVPPRISAALNAESAEQAVQIATEEVLALIKSGQAYAADDPERFYVEVEALLRPVIDFRRFARNVMGVHYRDASPEQRTRFADSFKWSLVRTYALALTEFREGEVNVLPPRRAPRDPNKVDVSMEIKFQGRSYGVIYRMQRRKELWQLQNLLVEGINIGLSYKSQFASAMKDPEYSGDMDKVIDAWTDFIVEGEDGPNA